MQFERNPNLLRSPVPRKLQYRFHSHSCFVSSFLFRRHLVRITNHPITETRRDSAVDAVTVVKATAFSSLTITMEDGEKKERQSQY